MSSLIRLIIIQCISVAFAVYISRTHTVHRVYVATFLNSCANMVMYAFNNDATTAIACAIVAVRGIVYIFRDKIRIPPPIVPAVFVAIHLAFGLLTITSTWQLLTIAAPCATCLYLWFGKSLQQFRFGNACVHIGWLVYDIHSGLFIVAIADAVICATNAVAFVQNRTHALAVVYGEKAVRSDG